MRWNLNVNAIHNFYSIFAFIWIRGISFRSHLLHISEQISRSLSYYIQSSYSRKKRSSGKKDKIFIYHSIFFGGASHDTKAYALLINLYRRCGVSTSGQPWPLEWWMQDGRDTTQVLLKMMRSSVIINMGLIIQGLFINSNRGYSLL